MKKTVFILVLAFMSLSLFAEYHGTKQEFKNNITKNVQSLTNGIYIDKDENYQDWSIKDNHTLVWTKEDYTPCGFKVSFKSLEDASYTEVTQEDKNIINLLSGRGVKDILISNNNQLTLSNPKVLNEIIELLELNNMRYGIDLSEESVNPLKGYLINPTVYRIDGPYQNTEIVRMWEEVDSGIYIVVNKSTGEIIYKSAIAKSNNGQIIIRLKRALNSNEVLLFYPHVTYFNNFDLWQGYNEIRDNILKYFKEVHLGAGFRFFYNPFNLDKLCKVADRTDFVPNSSGFNLTFENYLTNTYGHSGSLSSGWGIELSEENLEEISDFLKIFPLWNKDRGADYMYSLVTGENIKVNHTFSSYWTDLSLVKLSSIQEYMNSISTSIKENIANVPVIFSSSNASQSFTISFDKGTCDGFSSYYNTADIENIRSMGLLYTYSNSSPKTTLLFSVIDKPSLDDNDLDFLSVSGYKGFYFEYSPNNIKVISELYDRLSNYTHVGIPYPSLCPVKPQVLDDYALWYPSNDFYIIKKYGDNIIAYQKLKSTDATFFTLNGKQKITIVGNNEKECKIYYPENVKIKKGKKVLTSNEYTFEISEIPTVISNVDLEKVCPKECVEDSIKLYESFIKSNAFDKSFTDLMKENLKTIKNVYNHSSYLNAYGMVNEFITKFMYMVGADIWIEGENITKHSFNRIEVDDKASQKQVLLLDTQDNPKIGDYYATFDVTIAENKSYDLWLAISQEDISSPISVSADTGPWQPVLYRDVIPYSDDMVWVKAQVMNFSAGNHSINIKVTDMNKSTLKYYLALDAILLTNQEAPKGLEKPKYCISY